MPFLETEFIRWATEGLGNELPVGPGDDAAVLAGGLVVALDSVVESVHFDSGTPLELVARKALGACLSDVCAMGAVAEAVFVSAQLPAGIDGRVLAQALRSHSAEFGVVLAGGDTVSTCPGALALSVTATGRLADGEAPWLRGGARPGDQLVVSGALGGSRGGRHLRPRPRADLVEVLRREGVAVSACLDVSDGLARDLPRMTAASGVHAEVFADRIPVHADARGVEDPRHAALTDGEDFELLFAVPEQASLPAGCVVIGGLVERSSTDDSPGGAACTLIGGDGVREPWPTGGHEHVF